MRKDTLHGRGFQLHFRMINLCLGAALNLKVVADLRLKTKGLLQLWLIDNRTTHLRSSGLINHHIFWWLKVQPIISYPLFSLCHFPNYTSVFPCFGTLLGRLPVRCPNWEDVNKWSNCSNMLLYNNNLLITMIRDKPKSFFYFILRVLRGALK